MLRELHQTYQDEAKVAIEKLKVVAQKGDNIFAQLMETTKTCSIGQITGALFNIGGQYRRNM